MLPRRLVALAPLFTALAVAPITTGCSGESAGPGPTLVGTWDATSFSVFGEDLIAQGMGLRIIFTNGGAYTLTVTNDLLGACEPDPNCSQTGTYSASISQVTIDPGTPDAVTFNYSIQGSTLTLAGNVDGIPVTIVLQGQ